MRLVSVSLVFATITISGCGQPENGSSILEDSGSKDAAGYSRHMLPNVELSPDEQEARYGACTAIYEHWQEAGLWKHGGARPGVDRELWDKLSGFNKQKILDTAACLSTGGQVAPASVEVLEAGTAMVISRDENENRWIYLKPVQAQSD